IDRGRHGGDGRAGRLAGAWRESGGPAAGFDGSSLATAVAVSSGRPRRIQRRATMMRRIDRPRRWTALGARVSGLGLAASPAGQSVTGVVPNWSDLETWSRPISSTREVEHGLGLHVSGPSGTMLLSFSARLNLRSLRPPTSIFVVLAPPLRSNPNLIRKPT